MSESLPVIAEPGFDVTRDIAIKDCKEFITWPVVFVENKVKIARVFKVLEDLDRDMGRPDGLISRVNRAYTRAKPPMSATLVLDYSLGVEWEAEFSSCTGGAKFFLGRDVVFRDCPDGIRFAIGKPDTPNIFAKARFDAEEPITLGACRDFLHAAIVLEGEKAKTDQMMRLLGKLCRDLGPSYSVLEFENNSPVEFASLLTQRIANARRADDHC